MTSSASPDTKNMDTPEAGAPKTTTKGDADGEKKTPDPMASVSEVLSFMPDTITKIYFGCGIFCATASGMIFPAMSWLFAGSFQDLSGSTSEDAYLDSIRELGFSFMILGVVAFSLMTLQAVFMEMVAATMTTNLKTQWFKALLRQDMAYYDLRDISGTSTLISSNAIKFQQGLGKKLADGIQFSVTVILGMVYGFWSSWQVSLLVLAIIPFMAASTSTMIKLAINQKQTTNESYSKAGAIVYTTVSSIRTVLSLNAAPAMISKFSAATQEAYEGATKQIMKIGLANGSILTSFLLSYIPVTLYGAYILYDNVKESGCDPSGSSLENETCEPVSAVGVFGALFGVTFAGSVLPQVSVSIEAFMGAQSAAHPALEAINRTTKNSDHTEEALDDKSQSMQRRGTSAPLPKYSIDSSSPHGAKPESISGNIEFRNVHFSYPSRLEVEVFKGLSLHVPAGKTVALVGASGGGKSTVVHLLERFYDVKSGSIMLDGMDIRSLNIKWLREHIGLVSQEPKLFAQSIRDNIAIGCPGATQAQIEEAARKANAHDFIVSFPDGYDTQVGDEGAQLSGGQKQRIAIARVLIRKPKIILLDEATSALDSESEAVVQEALDALMQEGNQTIIVIAHRLSTIRNADLIAVISEGKVVETGSHQDLLSKEGAYFGLIQAQKGKENGDEDSTVVSSSASVSSNTQSEELDAEDVEVEVGDVVPVLRFRGVHFHYPSRPDNKIFRGIDLTVREGETLAIVGPSGQGKSTLIQLIESFYRPTEGTIEFCGVDMTELNVSWVREQLSLVSQEPVLFDASIRENIRFGRPGATQEDIEWAAKEANAFDFIQAFPDGFDTEVGAGTSLQVSGGQKQRIAIARALLRRPKVLLLDEATSALDSESETIVQEALNKIVSDVSQTTIVIAHRLSTIRNADRIAVIDHGKVCELGTHAELMALPNGRYRRLQDLQNLDAVVKPRSKQKEQTETQEEDGKNESTEQETTKEDKETDKKYAQRARLLAKGDSRYLIIGSIGAVMAGIMFPGWGFVFAYMIEALYYRVEPCDDNLDPPAPTNPEFDTCQEYWDDVADFMQTLSMKIFYGLLGIMVSCMVGNILMFWGFGTASERMNKRVRDAAFRNLVRQEVSYFDLRPVGSITSQLADDAALIHTFSGQPIRVMVMNSASVLIGIIVSFIYMWPFAFMTLGLLPFMSAGKALEIKAYMGGTDDNNGELPANSSGGIVVESLLNIRTVASLAIESKRIEEFQKWLKSENPNPIGGTLIKGSAGGIAQLVQMWGMGLMFWFGGWLLFEFPDKYVFRDMLISMFGLMFGLTGIGIAMADLADSEKAKSAAKRIFELIDRESAIDPLAEGGKKLN